MSHPDLDDSDPEHHEDSRQLAVAVAEAVGLGKGSAWARLRLVG